MKKKTIGILLIIFIVMIMSISAISAADANNTVPEDGNNTNIATNPVSSEQAGNANSPGCETGSNIQKINVNSNDGLLNQEGQGASSNLKMLSASNDNLVKSSAYNFKYNGEWFEDLDAAVSEASKNGGTIYISAGTYGYSDTDDLEISISSEKSITIEPFTWGTVTFDGRDSDGKNNYYFFVIKSNAHVTINGINFKYGKARDGGAIEVNGELTLNNCEFYSNHASSDGVSNGLGGAIDVDEGSLTANNCRFTNNKADRHGGAICLEDDGTVTLTGCYFNNNKVGDTINDFENYKGPTDDDWTFNNCLFEGDGSIDIDVDAPEKSVTIDPSVSDDVNYAVLYKNGGEYDRKLCDNNNPATFTDLDAGTYTVYMMKEWEKRYNYGDKSFTIIEPNFVLTVGQEVNVFENLSAAVNAIPNGGSGEISVVAKTYTESANFNVQITNKIVTIGPKLSSSDDVIFSSTSQNYLLNIGSNSQLTMEDIIITGKFSDSALKFNTNMECNLSGCEFKNIVNSQNQPGNPINAQNSKLVLDSCTFDSNSKIILENTNVAIDDCTFTNNVAINGGAIYADSSSNVIVTSSKFNSNMATDKGGAIYATNLEVHGTEFIGNVANLGGAVYITSLTNNLINMTNCVFDSNIATNYRNIYSESLKRKINLQYNEYDLNLTLIQKDGSYNLDYVLEGGFDWGTNLNNNFTLLSGVRDYENLFGELLTIEDNKFKINMGVLTGGTHEFTMSGMYTQGDSADHFYTHSYYSDLYGNEFYLELNKEAYAKIVIERAKISLKLVVNNVLIPETPVLNVYADWDDNYTIFVENKNYKLEVVNGKGSMQLTGLDLGNYTVVAMRSGDDNFYLAMNFTTFSISKTYGNFIVLSTNVEYATLAEAVAHSDNGDTIYVKNGTYTDTGIVISDKALDIIALNGAVFDAQGHDANFIIVNENAVVDIESITFRGIRNRNTNYGAIVNHGYLTLNSCNFTDNTITKTSFAKNGGAAVFSDGYSLEIDNCNFINNVAPLKVSTAAVTSLGYEDISITNSKFINNSAREGGALHFKNISQFEAAISSCDFEGNTAVKGSAIYISNNSKYIGVTLSNFKKNDIKNNLGENAQLEGGVIYVNANTTEVTFNIDSSNFENNSNRNVDGGVICLDGISKATIESCIFNNNKGNMGSVIFIKNPYNKKLTLFIDSSNFINNNAATGAIATSPKVTTFVDECLFVNNTGENRHIHSNGFTVVHDSTLEVKDATLNALSVQHGESSIINGTANIGTNINVYATVNLTVAGENVILEIENNTFSYKTGILKHGKYYATLNSIADNNNNTYLMDSITETFRVNNVAIDFNVSVNNITYGETLKVVEGLPQNATGTLEYQLNGKYYTKEEIETLLLNAGKYTLVAIYDHDDFSFTSSTVDFEVYKANPTISVADVEIKYGDNITLNIVTNVPSIYIIEIEDYKLATLVNGSKSVEINKTFNPGTYTIKVTSQERVNYISNFTEAILKVNGNLQSSMQGQSSIDSSIPNEENSNNANNQNTRNSLNNNNIGEESTEGKFIFQFDEDSDYEYCDSLEEAIEKVRLWESGTIMVKGGTYSGDEFRGIELEGELEVTIKAYNDEEVIFDCENADHFLHLTYGTEIEWVTTPPPPHPEVEQTDGPTVTLENITVINGCAGSDGGVIELDAGSLTLMNCNFRNNKADYGGVIYIGSTSSEYDATVIGVNTTFTNNYATDEGGAIYIVAGFDQDVSASFLLCTFLDNYQGENENRVINYFAGASVDTITAKSCIFNGNGTIYSLVIDKINQTVTVNGTSTDIFDSVVLLYSDDTPLYTIYNNGSRDFYVTFEDVMGGNYTLGTMNDHNFNTFIFKDYKFEMKVPNFIISDDLVYENLTDAIDAVVENGIIYANGNYYTEENMEIDIRKSFTLKNFRNREVTFDGSGEKWFFTIADGYTVVFDGICFTEGAIKTHATIENYGTLIIKNCSFTSFETGEIIHNSGVLNILNSTFSLNSVNNALVLNNGNLLIDTVEFSNNVVNISSTVYNTGVAEIVSSNFTENSNGGNGGAIYTTKSLTVKDTVFKENEGYDGGAIYNTGVLQVLNSTFEDNNANGYGGAIFNGNKLNISNSTFTGGFSGKDGGAIYNNHTMTADNSTFAANSATGNGGAIYNNGFLVLTKSFFGVNYADECANIYNAGDIQFSENTFDFYDVILNIPDGQYGIPTTITGTLNPEFNMNIQVTLPGFVDNKDADVTITDGVFEYVTDILPKGVYDVKMYEIIYDSYGNIYYGELISDRLIINRANVTINLTVDDVVLHGALVAPVLKISASKNGTFYILFNNKFSNVTTADGHATVTLDTVGEGNYSVMVVREGDENYNDAVNTTRFKVSEYEGNFIVNSNGHKFDTLRDALADSSSDDIIYVREGNYTGADNLGLTISGKKLSIISLGDVVFDGNSSDVWFLKVSEDSDVTIGDIAFTRFNVTSDDIIRNNGNLTIDGCNFINNTMDSVNYSVMSIIFNYQGNLNIVDSGFYGNTILSHGNIISSTYGNVTINESTFENNAMNGALINIYYVDSLKIISNVFAENNILDNTIPGIYIIRATECKDVLISSEFYNNTLGEGIIYANTNNNFLVNDSIFIGNTNTKGYIINSGKNTQSTISGCTFTENTVKNVVLSQNDKNLYVLESSFLFNTLSGQGALNIASQMNATVNGSVFTNNKADKYRNIYSVCDVNISNSVFDAFNVDYTVYDIDYGQIETIEGTIDIGTNLNFTVNLDINAKSYSVNVTDSKFTYNSGIFNGGDYKVAINSKDNNSNTYLFDKITKMFAVNPVDPGLNVSIANITQGEKLKVNLTINKNATSNVVYILNGIMYTKNQLENLTLNHGNYLITATYRGDKSFLPATVWAYVEVRKVAPNITVSDMVINYNDKIGINVSVDVADYYTVFLGNESISLYVKDSAIFTFPSEGFKPDSYEILVYVFETDDYAEAYANATLTVNKAIGVFNLTSDIITYSENATIDVEVPLNAYGNITYKIYDEDMKLVYNITQSCLEELVVPNLGAGKYNVTGTFEGDIYYNNASKINPSVIIVNTKAVGLNITVSDITYEENATVNLEAEVDGEYLVYVDNQQFVVTVIGGTGNVSVSSLTVGSYVANVTIINGNYSAFNETVFEVTPKSVSVVVSVEDIVYGEDAIVNIVAEVDGEYIVELYNQSYAVNVTDGKGNITFSNLFADKDILVSVSIVDGNYSAYNSTTFNVAPKPISAIISVGNITYGENAVVVVQAELDGDYIVTIRDVNYTISVNGGNGVRFIPNLGAGEGILASVSIVDGNYSAYNTTTFNVAPIRSSVVVSVEDIVYGEDAIVNIVAEIDDKYIVEIYNQKYTVNVVGGKGNTTISGLCADEDILVSVSIVEGNYSADNTTTFNVAPKRISVIISVENITYGEAAAVIVVSEIDGEYWVYVDVNQYIVTVADGIGGIAVDGLTVGDHYAGVTVLDGNYSGFDYTSFDVVAKQIDVSVSVDDITYGESAFVIVVSEIDGEYLVYVDDEPYTVSVAKGIGSIAVSGLDTGHYFVSVTVLDGNYSGFDFTSFDVKGMPYNISISVDNITYGENATVNVTLPDDATGTVTIGNDTVDVINGTASAVLTNLPIGNNTIPIIYSGDKKYTPIETNVTVVVIDPSDIISAPDVTKYYHGSERFVVTVTDYLGNPIAKKSVAVVINGMTYSRTTNANGTTSVALNLGSGVYDATTTVDNTTINSVITILPTVNGTDLVKVFRNNTQYYATFRDTEGNYLTEGTTVKFNINGVMYERKVVGDKGLAKLNINLQQGEYIITAMNPETGEMASNNIKVIPRIVENNDLTKYYRNASQYTVKLIGDDGNPVGAGENVTFNINGVFYTRTTNASGIAKLNINLNPGDYIVTAEYKKCKVSNNIKVLPTLTGKDLTKKYDQDAAFEATLVTEQGKPYPGQIISFNINGVFYTKTTDDNGIAKLNINLLPGKYIITSRYDQAAVSNNITVTA